MGKSLPLLTEKKLTNLAARLRDAYREECQSGECRCITIAEHEARLADNADKKK